MEGPFGAPEHSLCSGQEPTGKSDHETAFFERSLSDPRWLLLATFQLAEITLHRRD